MSQHNGKSSPLATVARDVGQVAHDVVELAELQTALVKTELQGWWKQFVLPGVLFVLATVIACCSLLILIVSAGLKLAEAASLSLPLALFLTACGAAVIALLIAVGGWILVKKAHGPLEASTRELSRNLRWIKSALKDAARSPATNRTKTYDS